jgi:hypothetical protein
VNEYLNAKASLQRCAKNILYIRKCCQESTVNGEFVFASNTDNKDHHRLLKDMSVETTIVRTEEIQWFKSIISSTIIVKGFYI